MFIPLLGFTDTDCTGHTDRQTDMVFFLHENPQFLGAKGTTKKAEALELFVYPNFGMKNKIEPFLFQIYNHILVLI